MPVEGRFLYWRDPLFLSSTAVYFLNRVVIKPHLHAYSPFFHGHLNDSLLVPVLLPLHLLVYRLLGLRPDNQAPRWWEIALHVIVWSIFYEWFGPAILHRSASDPWDVFCYALGGILAWIVWQQPWIRGVPRLNK